MGNHIVRINEAFQFIAIMAACIGDVPFTDKSASLINGPITRDVILIAQCGDGDVNLFGIGLFSSLVLGCLWMCLGLGKRHCSTGISIFLGKFAGKLLSVFRNIPALDGRFSLAPHPLPRGLHNLSIRNLPAPQDSPQVALG